MANIFLTNPVNAVLRMHECGQGEYWFYHKDTYPSDNPLMYQDLIDNATDEIIIWDPYFNVKPPNADQNVFTNIKNDITIKILTLKGLERVQKFYIVEKSILQITIEILAKRRNEAALRVVCS